MSGNPYLLQRYGSLIESLRGDPAAEEAVPQYTTTEFSAAAAAVPAAAAVFPSMSPLTSIISRAEAAQLLCESDDDDVVFSEQAKANYSWFPNAVHMTHTVFRPTGRSVVPLSDDRVAEVSIDDVRPSADVATTSPPPQSSHVMSVNVDELIQQTRAAMSMTSKLIAESTAAHDTPKEVARHSSGHDVEVEAPTTNIVDNSTRFDTFPQVLEAQRNEGLNASRFDQPATMSEFETTPQEVQAAHHDIGLVLQENGSAPQETQAAHHDIGLVLQENGSAPRENGSAPPHHLGNVQDGMLDSASDSRHCTASRLLTQRRVIVAAMSSDDAERMAQKTLSRKAAPFQVPELPRAINEVRPVENLIRPPPPVAASNVKKPSKKRPTKQKESRSHAEPVVPVGAVEKMFSSIYAIVAAQQQKSNQSLPVMNTAASTTVVNQQDQAVASLPRPFSIVAAEPSQPMHTVPRLLASPAAVTASPATIPPDDVPRPCSSATLPRVGVSSPSGTPPAASPLPIAPSKTVVAAPSSRLLKPTESWLHRGSDNVHTKPPERRTALPAARKNLLQLSPSTTALRTSSPPSGKNSFATVRNTETTKDDQVSRFNLAAARYLRQHSPPK